MWPASPARAAGKPVFGTLVALLRGGEPVLGLIDQPITRERWLGVAGRDTTLNGARVAARTCGGLGAAYLYATTPHMFAGASADAFARVRDQVREGGVGREGHTRPRRTPVPARARTRLCACATGWGRVG
jgi:fructose-1,6-bisphosphatase/inositol monophosphatase family enzyme